MGGAQGRWKLFVGRRWLSGPVLQCAWHRGLPVCPGGRKGLSGAALCSRRIWSQPGCSWQPLRPRKGQGAWSGGHPHAGVELGNLAREAPRWAGTWTGERRNPLFWWVESLGVLRIPTLLVEEGKTLQGGQSSHLGPDAMSSGPT